MGLFFVCFLVSLFVFVLLCLFAGVPELGQFHAMSVMEWTNVKTKTGEKVPLIRIRNPWGRRSRGGTWKERSLNVFVC